MEKRTLEHSDIQLSAVTLGAWAIGGWSWGGTERKASIRAIHACRDHGITSVDTAPIYGFGLSEKIVGEAIRGRRDQYEILTKAGMRWDGSGRGEYYFTTEDLDGREMQVYKYSGKESIIRECEESLSRLGTDYIDLYQIHWPDETTPVEETMEAFLRLREQGKIRAAGVSNYSVKQMERAASVIPLSSNQVPYSMVRRDIEEDVVPWCMKNGCSILAYSPLQRGLLTGKITPGYTFDKGDSRAGLPHFRKKNRERVNAFLDTLHPVAESKGATISQLVIAWTIRQPGITVALVGARNEMQAAENAGAAAVELDPTEIREISHALGSLKLDLD